jgi:hypothetical protein
MSQKYSGGFITKSPVAPTTSAASGIWTLDQQMQAQKAGTWPSPPIFIEDLFSTYLYTGNGSTQTITNGIDLDGEGGLVWIKVREPNGGEEDHRLYDTARGAGNSLSSNTTGATATQGNSLGAFNSDGFYLNGLFLGTNGNGYDYASWTFRKQPKFFDIVTYSGNSAAGREIAHNLGSTPGCIIVKRLDSGDNWPVYHRGISDSFLKLNTTDANVAANAKYYWGNNTIFIAPTSTVFTVATDSSINQTGGTYVAYLFAHDAGGFPVSGGGSTNGISCGSFTTDGAGAATVNLGYEPQWLITKSTTNAAGNWRMVDNMRQFNVSSGRPLYANLSSEEGSYVGLAATSTGFVADFSANETSIYIAIRRGPMKVPTDGTSVFAPVALPSPGPVTNTLLRTTNFPVDFYLAAVRNQTFNKFAVGSRLQGKDAYLSTNLTNQENAYGDLVDNLWDNNTGLAIVDTNCSWNGNDVTQTTILEAFRRAPNFFDEVCYTGTGVARTVTHNLTVSPEMIIVKCRSSVNGYWAVYHSGAPSGKLLELDDTSAAFTQSGINTPTSTTFTVQGAGQTFNGSGDTYVSYLFATCPGVSKVGSYTGTGTTLSIDCGFTTGARFVLIKRTDSTGDWYVWDSARGIVAGDDPYLLLNNSNAEVTNTDYIDTANSGFEISSTAPAAINANGGTYIFLAIA